MLLISQSNDAQHCKFLHAARHGVTHIQQVWMSMILEGDGGRTIKFFHEKLFDFFEGIKEILYHSCVCKLNIKKLISLA